MSKNHPDSPATDKTAYTLDVITEDRRQEAMLTAEALLRAIFNSANFSSNATDARGVIQIINVGARRIVFDVLDVVLAHELTGIITAKADEDETSSISRQPFGFMQFIVDCAVIPSNNVVLGVSQSNLLVQKYRDSSFYENKSAFLIGSRGFEIPDEE